MPRPQEPAMPASQPRLTRAFLLLLAMLLPGLALAKDTPACGSRAEGDERPRIGLVLGGGGARGFAHVSVLKELQRQRIPVDCIAGTSMGALIGGLYAAGMPADEIERELRAVDWRLIFNDRLERPERSFRRKRDDDLALVAGKPGIGNNGIRLSSGLRSGQRILMLLERLTQPVATRSNFDDLPIPFRAVAADLNTGRGVVLAEGNLAMAMRASMSIPGVFKPAVVDGRVLVDGGVANQVPVDVVRAMGADIVIAVDVGTPLAKLDESASLLSIIEQISGFMTVGSTNAQLETLGERDILVQPALGSEVSTADFGKLDLAMEIGDQSLHALRPQLAALALDIGRFDEVIASRPRPNGDIPVVDFVRLENRSRYADGVLKAMINIPTGEPLDTDALQLQLQRIYGLDTMDQVSYGLVEEEGRTGLVVTAVPHSHGPNYLESGLSLYSDFSGDFFVNLRLGVLRAPVNPSGGELRGLLQIGDEPGLLVDYYQPIGVGSHYFFTAQASYESPKFGLFDDDGERLANYRAPNWGSEVSVGREFGNHGAATLALRRRTGRLEREIGDSLFPDLDINQGEAELGFTFDRLDSAFLPRAGSYAELSYLVSRDSLGADGNFEQANLDVLHARAIGRHSGFAGLRYHVSSDDLIPIQGQFRVGGLTRFAGYRPNERVTENYALVYGGYTYELGRVMNRPAIFGGTIEYGRTWFGNQSLSDGEDELHGSLYFGFDSWLGPLQFGYGLRQGGEGVFLLELGQPR
jgi:NTE family protein